MFEQGFAADGGRDSSARQRSKVGSVPYSAGSLPLELRKAFERADVVWPGANGAHPLGATCFNACVHSFL